MGFTEYGDKLVIFIPFCFMHNKKTKMLKNRAYIYLVFFLFVVVVAVGAVAKVVADLVVVHVKVDEK